MSEELNPFAGIEAAFEADLKPVRYEFTLHDRACWVELRPMNAGAFASYVSKGQQISVDTRTKQADVVRVDMDQAASEEALLLGTITDLKLAYKAYAANGEESVLETPLWLSVPDHNRRKLLNTMTREFRQKLVQLAMEVNELNPKLPANGETP